MSQDVQDEHTVKVQGTAQILQENAENKDLIELDPSIEEIDLTNDRIKNLNLLSNCKLLKHVTMRQNEISDIAPLKDLPDVESVDLYLNRIEVIVPNVLCHLTKLSMLDLSLNEIRSIHGFEGAFSLQELYLVQNKISKIEGLQDLVNLRLLELGSNRIRVIENISHLIHLESLWLGRNKIVEFGAELCQLRSLRILSLQSNRITQIGGALRELVQLEELYLSHNGIERIEGLDELKALRVLDLTCNAISRLENLEGCTALEEVWLAENKIQGDRWV